MFHADCLAEAEQGQASKQNTGRKKVDVVCQVWQQEEACQDSPGKRYD